MGRGHSGLPSPSPRIIKKSTLLDDLRTIDVDTASRDRVLTMETNFRKKIAAHVDSLSRVNEPLRKFSTSPLVLVIHTFLKSYSKISEIEDDILPAKQFSSMETSAGRFVEEVALPAYGWEVVPSEMHSTNSAVDGKQAKNGVLRMTTLKSGPRCLNDSMSENLADSILGNALAWANEHDATQLDFTYGVLYGTKKQSNKKDWHILRNIHEKAGGLITEAPTDQWRCQFVVEDVTVNVEIRIGIDWWNYLGGPLGFVEVLTALIRACVEPGIADPADYDYKIADLGHIISMASVSDEYNVSLLQRSQIPWMFFLAAHYSDSIAN